MKLILTSVVALSLWSSSCMADTKHTTHLVVVSWYGKHWSGRHTSNGERFNPRMLTAASKTLPMGTRVLVKNGSKTVIVRINDRGPYVRGRSLDLSEAAAVRLGIRKQGVAKVSMKIVNAP